MKHLIVSQLKKIYSAYINQLSKKNSQKPLRKQVVYLLSFPNNDHGFIKALSESYQVTICYTKGRQEEALAFKEIGLTIHNVDSFIGLRETVKTVSESKLVIADNYFAFLGDIKKRHQQSFFQLWHATGAIKKFGLEDSQSKKRPKSDQNRFSRVYKSFDYFVVASKAMGEIFQRSYGGKESQMCYTGFPRTDYLIETFQKNEKGNKKIQILYLPTYRESGNESFVSNMRYLMEQLGDEYELKIKTHPHIDLSQDSELKSVKQILMLDSLISADDLLLDADILITDYSSVAFDYSLINPKGKLIFYWYDEANYRKETGLQPGIEDSLLSPVCHNIKEVISEVKCDTQDLSSFNEKWNTYNDGNATKRLLKIIAEKMDGRK